MTAHGGPPSPPTTNLNKGVGDYRANCPTAYPSFKKGGKKNNQVHHLVCVATINERKSDYPKDPDTKRYVEACLQLSGWDINNAVNLLGMATNRQHSQAAGMDPLNMPSHQVDHNNDEGYRLKDLRDWMKTQVWNTVSANKDPPHQHDVKKIKKALDDASKEMQRRLVARGQRGSKKYKGTAANWKNRHEADCKPTWFKPFSMAEDPVPRKPPVAKTPLKNIFEKL